MPSCLALQPRHTAMAASAQDICRIRFLIVRLFIAQSLCVQGNHQFLVRRDAAYRHLAVVCTEDGLRGTACAVLPGIHLYAHVFEAGSGTLAYLPLVLASATCEQDNVNTAHGSSILTYVLLYAVSVHLLGKASLVVACGDACQYVAEVRRQLADAGKARLLVQQVAQSLRVKVQLVHQESYGACIDVA